MKRFNVVFAALVALVVGLPTAQGAPIFKDDFDSYANQAAFQAAWPVVGTQPTGTLSTEQSVSPTNSVRIEAPVAGSTPAAQRNTRSFPETGTALASPTGQLVWSFDFYDSNGAASPYRQHANLQDAAGGATNQLISMGLNNNQTVANSGGNYYMARILGYSPANGPDQGGLGPDHSGIPALTSQYFKLNDFGVGLRSTGWHNLKVVISSDDGVATDYAFYVDGQLAETVLNVGGAGTLRSFDNIRIGAGVSSTEIAFYDNMIITVPEPATFALVGLSLFGLAFARRRNG